MAAQLGRVPRWPLSEFVAMTAGAMTFSIRAGS